MFEKLARNREPGRIHIEKGPLSLRLEQREKKRYPIRLE